MKYKTEELEKMTKEELVKTYREAKKSTKKDILKNLANSRHFAYLMSGLNSQELIEMAKLHPYKEVVIDTIINEVESHGVQIMQRFSGRFEPQQKINLDEFLDVLQHKSIFDRIKEFLTKKPALPETLPKKIEYAEKLCKIENRRINATGKKMEKLEKQDLNQTVYEPRFEVNKRRNGKNIR